MESPAISMTGEALSPTTSTSAVYATAQTKPKERIRIGRACDTCKRKKIRCTGTRPCRRCTDESILCAYDTPYVRGKRKKSRVLPQTPPECFEASPPPTIAAGDASLHRSSRSISTSGNVEAGVGDVPATLPPRPETENNNGSSALQRQSARASPEAGEGDRQGHFVGASSGLSIFLRLQRRLWRGPASVVSETSVFNLGDPVLPEFDDFSFTPPPRDEAQDLLRTYFELASPTYRFLHRPTIQEWLQQLYDNGSIAAPCSQSKYAVLLSMFAQATRYTTPERLSDRSNGLIYFQAAERQLAREKESATLVTAQALLGSCFYVLTRSRLNHCWSLFGTTSRLILALGLHRKRAKFNTGQPTDAEPNRTNTASPCNYIDLECRKRLFWCAYNLDKYLSTIFGRPCALQDGDIDQDMPEIVDDADLTADKIVTKGDERSDSSGTSMSTMMGPLHHQKLGRILSATLKQLYGIDTLNWTTRHQRMAELGARVDEWQRDLPVFLNPDKVHSRMLVPLFQRQSNLLSLASSHALMLIYRPCLFNDFRVRRDAVTVANVHRCRDAAMRIVAVIEDMAAVGQFYNASWFSQYQAFCAVIVLYTYTLRIQRHTSETAWAEFFHAAECCQHLIATVTTPESLGGRFFVIMEEFRQEVLQRQHHTVDAAVPTPPLSLAPSVAVPLERQIPMAPLVRSASGVPSTGGYSGIGSSYRPRDAAWLDAGVGSDYGLAQQPFMELPNWEQLDSLALDLGDIVPDLNIASGNGAQDKWTAVADNADVVEPTVRDRSGFLARCRNGDFDGVVAIYRTYYSAAVTGLLDEELVQALPASVRFISHSGAGYDQINVAACTARGISVSNVPDEVNDATADAALFLMLGALRGFYPSMVSLRAGSWRGSPAAPLGHDPQHKTLGIFGCGGVGTNFARKAVALGMKVVYHNRRRSGDIADATYVPFAELLQSSDVISVCLPLNAGTRHILSDTEFAAMKDGVVIVNTARGPVIDEDALARALDSGKVWSCGLDVFENEPEVHPGLLAHPRAMLLPHLGTYTVETHTRMEERCIANVRSALETGKLQDLVSSKPLSG